MGEQYRHLQNLQPAEKVADTKNVINQLTNCNYEKWYEGQKQML